MSGLSRRSLLLAASASFLVQPASARNAPPAEAIPREQAEFARLLRQYALIAEAGGISPAGRSDFLRMRGRELAALLGDRGEFKDWACICLGDPQASPNGLLANFLVVASGVSPILSAASAKPGRSFAQSPEATRSILAIKKDDAVLVNGRMQRDVDWGYESASGDRQLRDFTSPAFLVEIVSVEQTNWLDDAWLRSRGRL